MKIASEWGISKISWSLSGTELQQKQLRSSAGRNCKFFFRGLFFRASFVKAGEVHRGRQPFSLLCQEQRGPEPGAVRTLQLCQTWIMHKISLPAGLLLPVACFLNSVYWFYRCFFLCYICLVFLWFNFGPSVEGWRLKPGIQKRASPPMTSQICE